MLTSAQVAHFRTFGFLVMRNCFEPREMACISGEFDEVMTEHRHGEKFSGDSRQAVVGFVEKREVLAMLVDDDRVYQPLQQLLGPDFVWIGSDGNLYVGDTRWHSDGSMLDYLRIKVAFYLDPVSAHSGCLRVVPCSHRAPLHDDLNQQLHEHLQPPRLLAELPAQDIPACALESRPGDVVLFDQNLWHAAFGGKSGRRMFTMNFASSPATPDHIRMLKIMYEAGLAQTPTPGRIHEDAFMNSDRPRIRGMMQKRLDLGFK